MTKTYKTFDEALRGCGELLKQHLVKSGMEEKDGQVKAQEFTKLVREALSERDTLD
jgi:hypothetical protein